MSTLTPCITTFQSSGLSRASADVFAAAADHPVRVTRRNGGALVAVSTSADGSLASRMIDSFPWMLALSLVDQEDCANDILTAARASFATNQHHLAIAELTSWRETATAFAAGQGQEPVERLDDSETLGVPEAGQELTRSNGRRRREHSSFGSLLCRRSVAGLI